MTDWLPELSDDDLATLIEAVEAWEDKGAVGEMFGDVIEMVLGDRTAGVAEAVREKRAADKVKAQREKAMRKERSVLLRAKLLTLRDRRRVEAIRP